MQKGPARSRALLLRTGDRSVLDLRRQLAAIGGELGHYLLVQPDVHGRGIVGVAAVAELLGEVLARGEAGIDVERLHEVDDRGAPFQLFALVRGDRRVDDRGNVHRRRGRRSARRGPCGRAARWCAACGRGGSWMATEDRAHNFPENAHVCSPKRTRWKALSGTYRPSCVVAPAKFRGPASSISLSTAK